MSVKMKAELYMHMMLFVTILCVLLSPHTIAAQEFTGTLAEIQHSGKIRVGYRTALPPMSYANNKGEPQGYSIDLCSYIVADVERTLGKEISTEYLAVTAENRFTALVENKIDILCGAATETIARREIVDFTQHIFVTGGSYMVRKGTRIRNNFEGKKIGVVRNTTTAAALTNLFAEAAINAEVIQLGTTAEGFNKLLDAEIDAFSADQVVLIGLVVAGKNLGEFRILPDLFSFEPIALAVRRNDADFRLIADRVLADLYRCEEIDAIFNKWFRKITGDQPPAVRAVFQLNALPE